MKLSFDFQKMDDLINKSDKLKTPFESDVKRLLSSAKSVVSTTRNQYSESYVQNTCSLLNSTINNIDTKNKSLLSELEKQKTALEKVKAINKESENGNAAINTAVGAGVGSASTKVIENIIGKVNEIIESKDNSLENISLAEEVKNKYPDQAAFIESILPAALKIQAETGIPWQVIVAQTCLETGYGKHAIPEANNYHGIKYFGDLKDTDKYVMAWTKEQLPDGTWIDIQAAFCKFDSIDGSFEAYKKVMLNKYFEHALRNKNDPAAYIKDIQGLHPGEAAHPTYATALNYADTIISIMKMFGLLDLDVSGVKPVEVTENIPDMPGGKIEPNKPAIQNSYTVKSGDTLTAIANKHGVTVDALVKYNGIKNPNLIYPGQIIKIPPKDTAISIPLPDIIARPKEYTVKSGDTLTAIAAKYGVTVAELAKYNGIANPNLIYPGQVIKIPSKSGGDTEKAPIPKEKPSTPSFTDAAFQGIYDEAIKHMGKPYVFGAEGPDTFDCSGFVQYVFTKNGISIPRTVSEQQKACTTVSREDAKPGDLIFFKDTYKTGLSHVGIYLGDGKMIHTGSNPDGVTIVSIDSSYYQVHFHSFGRP